MAQGQNRRDKQSNNAAIHKLTGLTWLATAQTIGLGLIALTLLASSQPTLAQDASGRQVKDFKHRKRMIVPPSENVRRIDYQALPGRDSLMLPNYVPKFPPAGAGGGNPRYTSDSNGYQNSGSDPYASGLPPANSNSDAMYNDGGLSATADSLGSTTSQTGRKPIGKVSRAGIAPPPPPIKSSLLPNSLTKELPAKTNSVAQTQATTSSPHLSPQKIAQVKAQAEALAKKGKPAEAQTLLSTYLKGNPHEKTLSTELSRISLQRAQSQAKAGNHEAATQQARLAITHGEHAPEIVQAAHGTLNSSLQKIGIKANAPEDRFDLGTKLMGQARYEEAVIEYSAAAKLKPSVEAYLGAGGAAMKGGRQLQAKKYFQDALELNPNSEPALRELGIARYHLKDYAGASADLTRALVLNQGDKEAASTLLELWHHQVASRPTDANSHLGLARAYQVAGDLPAAQNEYKTVVKIHPDHPNLPAARQSFKLAYAKQEAVKAYELAQSLESQGSLLSAYQKASDAVHLYPSEIRYQNYSAQLAAKLQASAQPNTMVNNPSLANAAFSGATAGLAAMPNGAPDFNSAASTANASTANAFSAMGKQSTLVPGSTPEAPPNLIPTAQAMGLAPAAVPAISTAPFAHENMYQPISTDRQVSSMSNFLVSLRNFTMQQQNQIRDAEDNSIWTKGTARKPAGLPGLGGDADAALDTTLAGSVPSGLPSGLPATTSAIQAAPQSSSVADVLKNAAMALANTNSGSALPSVATSSTTSSTSSSTSSSISSSATSSGLAAGATATATATAAAAPALPNSYASWAMQAQDAYKTSGIGSLASMTATSAPALLAGKLKTVNKQDLVTAAQKAATRFTAKPSAAKAVAASPAPSPVPLEAPPQTQAMPYMQNGSGYQQSSSPSPAPQYDQISQINSLQTNNQQLQAQLSQANSYIQQLQSGTATAQSQTMPTQSPMQGQPLMQSPVLTQASGSVRLLLQGVKAAKDDVQLKVLLLNESGQEIKLPSNLKATVRSASQGERQGKASFSSKTVSPGGSVSGTIKIAGSNLDPTADVVIPASSLAILGMGDLHLTVPISQR